MATCSQVIYRYIFQFSSSTYFIWVPRNNFFVRNLNFIVYLLKNYVETLNLFIYSFTFIYFNTCTENNSKHKACIFQFENISGILCSYIYNVTQLHS